MYTFRPPAYYENPAGYDRLFIRFLTPQGVTVAKIGSDYHEFRYEESEAFVGYDKVYRGGYVYTVDDAEAADLISAGYEVEEVL